MATLKDAKAALDNISKSETLGTHYSDDCICMDVSTIRRYLKDHEFVSPDSEPFPAGDTIDIKLADGSVLRNCLLQSDGDIWWGQLGNMFIDPAVTKVTGWRLSVDI